MAILSGCHRNRWENCSRGIKSTISRHIRNIFTEGELDEKVVVAEIATTSPHGANEGENSE